MKPNLRVHNTATTIYVILAITANESLKVHKLENFFGSDFENFYFFIVTKLKKLKFCKNRFFVAPLLWEIGFSADTETKGNRL